MLKKYYLSGIFPVVLIGSVFVIFSYAKMQIETSSKNYVPMNIRHGQYIDFTEKAVISDEQKGISSGDIRWEATGYQYGGTGTINSKFMISMHPTKYITVSRLKKIQSADFASVSRATCKETKYDETDVISRVNDDDIFCISSDKNRDGEYGDDYVKLKIISHKDSNKGNYADSVTFIYEVL